MRIPVLKPWQRIALHVILPAALTLFLFAAASLFETQRFEELLYNDQKQFLQDMMDFAFTLAQDYQLHVQKGEMSLEQARQAFKEQLRAIRYGPQEKDYFWLNDLNGYMIMHPYRPDLEGQDVTNLEDVAGKRLTIEFNEKARQGGGYVEYMWQWHDDPNRIEPKLAYVRLVEPWGWVIGTGIYVDELYGQIDRLTQTIHRNTALIFLIVALLCSYLIWQGFRTEMQNRAAQEKLKESFERFKTILNSVDAIIFVSDVKTQEVLFVNRCGLQEISEKPVRYCWQVLHEDQTGPCETCRVRSLLDETAPSASRMRQIHEQARDRWYECRDQLIRWVDGRLVCLEVALDITERKRAEHEREDLMKKLTQKNEDLQSIVYAASHDLRSPLINIQGFARELGHACGRLTEMMRRPEGSLMHQSILQTILDEEIPESLDFIYKNTEKMQTLVNGMLQLSRIGTARLQFRSLDMNALIGDVLTASGYQIKTIGAEITVEPNLPSAWGDYNQINQVFSNLIDNALKYRQRDRSLRITISGKVLEEQVEYAVSDNGIGIPKMHLQRIFELFQQLKPGTADGVGLGLTIVKRILDIHNGAIRVESEPGEGSTFFITLPKG